LESRLCCYTFLIWTPFKYISIPSWHLMIYYLILKNPASRAQFSEG
jgi:hypothetical protein